MTVEELDPQIDLVTFVFVSPSCPMDPEKHSESHTPSRSISALRNPNTHFRFPSSPLPASSQKRVPTKIKNFSFAVVIQDPGQCLYIPGQSFPNLEVFVRGKKGSNPVVFVRNFAQAPPGPGFLSGNQDRPFLR